MTAVDPPTYQEFVDVLRVRIDMADDLKPDEFHDFKEMTRDWADVAPDHWYHKAFDDLQARGHLDPGSRKVMGNAHARLSPEGREYLRMQAE